MAGLRQDPVTFDDVAIYLSRAEWDAIGEGQQELYRTVMLDNYKLLTSLGYPGPKPDILYRLERGEEPWVCTPRSPVRWDGPDSPSPAGHDGDGSRLEELPSGWWPGAGGHHVPEERTEMTCQGGQCTQWRLRSRRLLNKFKCLEDSRELLAEVTSGGLEPAESQDQARTVSWPGKEAEAEDKEGVMADLSQSREFPLHPVMEQQNQKANPQEHVHGEHGERFQRTAPKSQCTLGGATFFQGSGEAPPEELHEAILKDHCYCVTSEEPLLGPSPRPCPLREHDYCRNHKDGVSALKDHDYCHMQRIRYQGRVNETACLTAKARAALYRLAARKSHMRRLIRKARRIMWHYRPWVNKRLEFPQISPSASCCSEPPDLPAEAEDNPATETFGVFHSPAKQEAVATQAWSEGSSQGATSAPLCPPMVSSEPLAAPRPSSTAAAVKKGAAQPKAPVQRRVQRARLSRSPDPTQNVERREAAGPNYVSLHNAYKMVMRTVDHMLDSRVPELRAQWLLSV